MAVPTLSPTEFVAKWSRIQQKERSTAQSHFNDLCRLVGHPEPLAMDPGGRDFVFEIETDKPGGEKGFADVFYRGRFIMEYKGPHKDLAAAYRQLQLYRESLHNPPLLITSDLHTVEIYTNFTNRPTVKSVVTLDDIATGPGVDVLRRAFTDPDSFMPERTREVITKASADSFLAVAEQMKLHQKLTGEAYSPEQLAHFLVRLLFCLFAEDLGLLPDHVLTETLRRQKDHTSLQPMLKALFAAMRDGGVFGYIPIRHFNGTLFDDDFVPEVPADLVRALLRAAEQDWSAVDPSIFGTIFERVIDPDKRAQLGAHYTSQDDIMLIVEPVLMEPLRREWDEVRRGLSLPDLTGSENLSGLSAFADKLAATRVLDPACGSGNFLYMALRELLNLQKQVIAWAARRGLDPIPLTVSPQQLYGIEINPYAHELAQITAWIGYLQWRHENGFAEMDEPILKPLHNIRHMDAILAYDEAGRPVEPEWPAAEVIIGNPPFLGGKKMRAELGDSYVPSLFSVYESRVPHEADLVCYWFEKAHTQIVNDLAGRAGLIATNSIRGGPNRRVLERIKEAGDIFLAWSDKPWILDGAAVRVSIVGFDDGSQQQKGLDGSVVSHINTDLTSAIDLGNAKKLVENGGLSFMGVTPAGEFDVDGSTARKWLTATNASGKNNSDVLRPYFNGTDITRGPRDVWIVDYGVERTLEEAQQFELPFQHVEANVYPTRQKNNREAYRDKWWLHAEARSGMRNALAPLSRFIGTSMVAKHRLFQWLSPDILPANLVIVVARDDDYFFGVLHARPHEIWALRLGTSLEDRPRYTPTTSFETYPFPWAPGQEPSLPDLTGLRDLSGLTDEQQHVAAIARWARELVAWRDRWLNPPPDEAAYLGEKRLKARTLTNLYNGLVYYRDHPGLAFDRAEFDKQTRKSVTRAEIVELDDIHRALDSAVLRAYGWPDTLTDEQSLERLLALNLARAAASP
jgi:SAM-dependent methyltransferase